MLTDANRPMSLIPCLNGGWLIRGEGREMFSDAGLIAAFTTTGDMLAWLAVHLRGPAEAVPPGADH